MRTRILVATTCLLLACGQKAEPVSVKAAAAAAVETPKSGSPPEATPPAKAAADPVIDHVVQDIDGNEVKLADYRGKALLIVNTASECGATPQYAGLQELHAKYEKRGLVVLGFPSNDFGEQEPGTHEEIKKFTTDEFGVTFPLFSKVKTKGDGQAALYKTLTEETLPAIQGEVQWNFTKFLVDADGKVVARFNTKVEPTSEEVIEAIESVLPAKG
jgi:glutathione peroxidase